MADGAYAYETTGSVRSRVSWAAIMAGSVVAIAVHVILSLLGAAIGLTASDSSSAEALGTGAAIWGVITTLVAMFIGGWVAMQMVVGESKGEALVHSIIMWGGVMSITLGMVALGARTGSMAMLGYTQFAETNGRIGAVENVRQRANEAAAQVDRAAQDPAARQEALNRAKAAAWWAFVGVLASLGAAIAGGISGAGGTHRLMVRDTTRNPGGIPRTAGA
ncbi:MAG TPA: hypothetical protein VNC50_03015 [Planctomycetia bacterium]|nr:hypothetical protein [Planctomycetia bacterium]